MQYILNSEEMKRCDENTMGHFCMLSAVLMERAALGVAEEIIKRYPKQTARVVSVCGAGNNGGDGIAAARLLFLAGYPAMVVFVGQEEKASIETKRQLLIARQYGVPISDSIPDQSCDIIIDAIFGIGLCRDVTGKYADYIREINQMEVFRLSVDIASGLNADDGAVMGAAVCASCTVTFGFQKVGHLLGNGPAYSGKVIVKEMGIDGKSLRGHFPSLCALGQEDLCMSLPKRQILSNKSTYGKILIFAGSYNMAGAAALSARAAYASGCGMVKIVTPECNRQIIQTLVPEALLATYKENTDMFGFVRDLLPWCDAIVAGPGIGTGSNAAELLKAIIELADVPVTMDADALNILSENLDWTEQFNMPVVVTPHLGEMARLTGLAISQIQAESLKTAREFAKQNHVVTVLKDAKTLTAEPEGKTYVNLTGNNGMASAGSGDVLAGIMGGFLARISEPGLAAALAVCIHGLAGDAAARKKGKNAMTASDMIDGISDVMKLYESDQQ